MSNITHLRSDGDSWTWKRIPPPNRYTIPHTVGHQLHKHMCRERLCGGGKTAEGALRQKHADNSHHNQPMKHFSEKRNLSLRLCWAGSGLFKHILVNLIMGSSQAAACLLVNFFKEALQPTSSTSCVLIASTKSRRKLKRLTHARRNMCGSLERWWLVPPAMTFIFHQWTWASISYVWSCIK